MAKKTSLTQEARAAILEALRKAMPLSYACDLAAVPRRTCYDEMERNFEWRTQVYTAKAEAIRGLVALTGKQGGAWKLLKNLGREEFKEHIEQHFSEELTDVLSASGTEEEI